MVTASVLSVDAEEVTPDDEVTFLCPLWVFLRSGLAVPKAVARKPLPQKVSALDPGIGSCHRLLFLPDEAVSISVGVPERPLRLLWYTHSNHPKVVGGVAKWSVVKQV